jgi:replicative DNA helicase
VIQQPRELPRNIEAEAALIGAILLNNEAFVRTSAIVHEDHFFEEIHGNIWATISALVGKGQVANPVLLKTYLGNPEIAPGRTLLSYLTDITMAASSNYATAESYARTVRDQALMRSIIEVGGQLQDVAYEAPVEMTADVLFAQAESKLEALRPSVQTEDHGFQDFDDISMQSIYDAHQHQRGVVGLSTGLARLDDTMNGLQDSDLIVIAGRPGMGKTALATGISVAVARNLQEEAAAGGRGGVVGIFSLEMSSEQLKHRVVSDMASVVGSKLAKGLATQEEIQAFHDAERELRNLPLKIDDRGGLTIAQIKMRARNLHRRSGLRLLVIDYLQLLSGTKTGRDFNRTQEVTEITTGLKALAKELKIPVIALSQLSRDVEKRDDKRPQMSDLRESGSIEQDADAVLLVFREEYYHRNLKPREDGERLAEWARKMEKIRGLAEVNVTKNRHGGDGIVELGWIGEFTRFTNDMPWRPIDPDEARQKAKTVPLSKHGAAMRDILKEMAVAVGRRPTPKHLAHKPRLPHNALMIVRDEVKEEMRTKVLTDLNDGEFRKAMQAAADNLRHAGLTQVYKDEDEIVWIYLVEIIGE